MAPPARSALGTYGSNFLELVGSAPLGTCELFIRPRRSRGFRWPLSRPPALPERLRSPRWRAQGRSPSTPRDGRGRPGGRRPEGAPGALVVGPLHNRRCGPSSQPLSGAPPPLALASVVEREMSKPCPYDTPRPLPCTTTMQPYSRTLKPPVTTPFDRTLQRGVGHPRAGLDTTLRMGCPAQLPGPGRAAAGSTSERQRAKRPRSGLLGLSQKDVWRHRSKTSDGRFGTMTAP